GRHTMSYGDWSSDVCSSDLACPIHSRLASCRNSACADHSVRLRMSIPSTDRTSEYGLKSCDSSASARTQSPHPSRKLSTRTMSRTEERRVGEEWKTAWARQQ